MSYELRALAMVKESTERALKGETMPGNEPDDMRTNETNEALEATPATAEEVIAFVKRAIPKADDVGISQLREGIYTVILDIDSGDVER